MAFMRKTKNMLKLERDLNLDDIRQALLESYHRNNTLRRVAQEYGVSESTMGAWFRQLGLHTRASLPAVDIPQDLSDIEDATNYTLVANHPRNQPTPAPNAGMVITVPANRR
jgi:hypothetical protein